MVIERPVLLAPLARYPGGRWGLETGGCGHIVLLGPTPSSARVTRPGSASGKRIQGYPGPPWRFPPVSYPRAGGLSTAQGSPCAGRRALHLVAHIRKTPVLSQLARTCKFGAKRSFLLDRPLRSRWRLCRLRMRRTPCGCGPFVSGPSAAAHAAVGLRHAPAGAVFLSRTKREWGVESPGDAPYSPGRPQVAPTSRPIGRTPLYFLRKFFLLFAQRYFIMNLR